MSKFKIVDQDKYTAVVFDEKADRTFTAAVGPVQRLQVLAEIQDDPGCNTFDLGIALVIERHINSKTGFAKIKQKTIANASGVSPRTVERRLKELDTVHGHLVQIRQGPTASVFFLVIKEPPADKVLVHRENRHDDGSDKRLSDLSEDERTATQSGKNRHTDGQEPPLDANALYIEPNDLTQRSNSAAPSRRQRASSAQADAAPTPREPVSVSQYPASPFPKDFSPSSDGSLTRLMARSPSDEDSQNETNPPLAGKEIPQTSRETRSGAASLLAADDWRDDDCDSDMSADDEERLLEKERREEERDDEIMRQRNAHTSAEDDLDANIPF